MSPLGLRRCLLAGEHDLIEVLMMMKMMMVVAVTKAAAAAAATAAGDVVYISIMMKMINFRSKYIVTSTKRRGEISAIYSPEHNQ
ncbi:hypothetical protein F2P81_004461 [Scophthalmus maximus]|uniref:Uncharacterized protein n=1 Tax=Scophthalmus maximus TaxID=52904 RepID=A0A6A4TIT8_SCOMX|nr:hypothetical protein F2P81_004461 [Scophthalmus maximus]